MTTARDIVTRSLRLIEELGAGQTARSEDCADALTAMIAMLDSLSINGQLVFTETVENFTLTAGDGDYTIGSSGDFNTVRPVKLRSVTITNAGGTSVSGVDIISAEEYASLTDLTTTGTPDLVYYDGNYPLGKLRFNPIPSTADTVTIYSEKPITNVSALDDVLSMPPGYEDAIAFNLAVRIAPEFGKQASPTVMKMAAETKFSIMSQNAMNDKVIMSVDDALLTNGNLNVYTRK